MNLQTADIECFVRIVERGSLSAAARERNVPVSQVTRSLARLEATLRVRLLHRTTHALSLTDEGELFLAHARRLIETTAELHGELSGKLGGPSGWVRLSVSPVIAQTLIAPSLVSLSERHPNLHVDIHADDRMVDMARDGIDIAIRTGNLAGEHLVARPIGELSRSLYAAPSYLRRHGAPRSPADLDRHRLLGNSASPTLNHWTFDRAGEPPHALEVRGQARSDNTAVLLALAAGGVGIIRAADIAAQALVAAGTLVRLLDGWSLGAPVPMYAVMLQERHRLPKVRACIEHWADWFAAAGAGASRRPRR